MNEITLYSHRIISFGEVGETFNRIMKDDLTTLVVKTEGELFLYPHKATLDWIVWVQVELIEEEDAIKAIKLHQVDVKALYLVGFSNSNLSIALELLRELSQGQSMLLHVDADGKFYTTDKIDIVNILYLNNDYL